MKTPSFKKSQWGILSVLFLLVVPSARSQNPVPFIDILSPTSTYPGHGDFVLTISGANFTSGATVQFDGLTLTPISLTRNSLTVTVPTAAVASAHTASVTVKDPNSNSSNLLKSNVAFFPITTLKAFLDWANAFSVLDPPSSLGLNQGPPATAIAVGDFNGDGHQDVVVALPGGILEVYKGDGKGNFTGTPPLSTPGLGYIFGLEVGDFNNDGYLDVAATDGGTVGIFFNDGTGALSPGPTTTLSSTWVTNFCGLRVPHFGVADFDGDGFLDLALPQSAGPEVAVLLGDGFGHFTQSSTDTLVSVNNPLLSPCSVTVGDFNNDGWIDLAYLSTYYITGTFSFNDGKGGFSSATSYHDNSTPDIYPAGDMNGDGFLDLVEASDLIYNSPSQVAADVAINQQNGTFATTGPVTYSGFVWDQALGDLTGGGALDAFNAVSPGARASEGAVGQPLIGNGNGSLTFNPPLSGASLDPVGVRLADFNEDGRLDVAYVGATDPKVGPNGVAFEYWLQIPGPPIWSVPQKDFGTVILHLGQMSGNPQPLTEVLSNSGPGILNIANICSKDPGPVGIGTAPAPAGSNPCPTGTGSVNFPISAAASTCPLNGGAPGTNAGTLQPGANCTVAVGFQPSTFGAFSGTLTAVDDANGVPGSVQNVTLTGTAIELDANVQSPINADGSSVFNSQRGVVPVKFTLQENFVTKQPGPAGCQLPPATIGIIRTAGGAIGPVDTAVFEMAADNGANFRIDTTNCQYIYNVGARSLGPGTYSVQIFVNPADLGGRAPGPIGIGSATFGLH